MTKDEERSYYDNLLAQMDHDINVKNGIAQPQAPKGKR